MSDLRELARAALSEIAPESQIGDFVGTRDGGDHLVSYLWASRNSGYPDWHWTVTVAELPGDEPSVVELELLPTEESVLAPDWVPWSVRLAEYRAAQAAAAAAGESATDEESAADDLGEDLGADARGDEESDDDEIDDIDEFDDIDDEDDDDIDDDEDDDDVDELDDDEDDDDDDDELDDDLDRFQGITLPGEEEDDPATTQQ